MMMEAINDNALQTVHSRFTEEMKDLIPFSGPWGISEYARWITRRRGKLVRLGEPLVRGRIARFPLFAERGEWALDLMLSEQGEIANFSISDPEQPIPIPKRNSCSLRLPFMGTWTVVNGGELASQNYHVATGVSYQIRAIDFVVCNAAGESFLRDGMRNEDYFAYGKEVLAPADGIVVTAIDGVPDNKPSAPNPSSSLGNSLVLKHGELEYSVLCHLQPHSIFVSVGDHVKVGQTLARCGNSGNSKSPHLHFHMMNAEAPQTATGFRPYFQKTRLWREGRSEAEEVKNYSPVRGDRVQQVEETRKSATGT
jgi:murein DD-endopeptidase MepM/ murein hydrolase activator NlpD